MVVSLLGASDFHVTNFSSGPLQHHLPPSCLLMKLKIYVGKVVKLEVVDKEACPEVRKAEEEKTHSVYKDKSLDRKGVFSRATSLLGNTEGSDI